MRKGRKKRHKDKKKGMVGKKEMESKKT